MTYFPSVILFFIHCFLIHAAETKQYGSMEDYGYDLIVSDSLLSILNMHPGENTKLLNLIATTTLKIQNRKDGILEKIRQSTLKSSVSQSIMAMETSYECTINERHRQSFSLKLEETVKTLDIYFNAKILPIETQPETLALINTIVKNGKIGESYEYLFKVSPAQFWILKITLQKDTKWIRSKIFLNSELDIYRKVSF